MYGPDPHFPYQPPAPPAPPPDHGRQPGDRLPGDHLPGDHPRRVSRAEERRAEERPGKGRLYALAATAVAGVLVVVGLATGGGGLVGAGAEQAGGTGAEPQTFVNGAAIQERDAGEAAGASADIGKAPAARAATPQVRLVGPSEATAGRPFTVAAAFRDLPDGAGLRAYVQALRPDGRVGATEAVASCRLTEPGEGDTLTGRCPAVAAGSYRIAVVVEKATRRQGDFPAIDVGRLVVRAADADGTDTDTGGSGTGTGTGGGSGNGNGGGSGGQSGSAPAPDEVRAVEQRMVELTNQARREAGVGTLSVDSRLTSTSRDWSCDMAAERDLEHDPNFADSGAQGENVAFRTDPGNDVALLLHEQFMNSPGHRDNILNPRWNKVGIGFCAENGFWVTERFAP